MPNGRCHKHGGKSLVGIAHSGLTHGRYSKHLPTRLLSRYNEAKSDGDLTALREEIALTDARLADLLARVDTGEAGSLWEAARKAMGDYDAACNSGRDDAPYRQTLALSTLRDVLNTSQDYEAWNEVQRMVEQRRRLVDTESKRLEKLSQSITAEKAMLLMTAVVGVIREHVRDRDTLAAVSAGIGRLISVGDEPVARSGLPGVEVPA